MLTVLGLELYPWGNELDAHGFGSGGQPGPRREGGRSAMGRYLGLKAAAPAARIRPAGDRVRGLGPGPSGIKA